MVKKTIKRNKYKYNIGGFLKDTASSLGSISSIAGAAYGLGNTLFGSQKNEQAIQNIQNNIDSLKNANFNTQSADSLLADYQNQNLIGNINKNDLGSDGLFSNKIAGIADELRFKANQANIAFFNNLNRASQQLSTNKLIQDQLANNIAAYGGLLDINNQYSDGGEIYIKPENRGKFTALKERTGKSATWFKEHGTPAQKKMATFALNARKWKHSGGGPIKKKTFEDWYKTVPADRNDTTSYNLRRAYELAPYSELEAWRTSSIKDLENGKNHLRSIYRNPNTGVYEFVKSKNHPTLHFETDWYKSNDPEAIKFRKEYDLDMSGDYYKYVPKKKAFGGELTTKNTTFNNGITYINNGDTHENNAYEGVQIGMDNEGVPNLVEQDELIYNDYVIPKRVKATKELLSSVNLPTKYAGKSLADIGKKLSKESQETPNDPISKNTLDKNMNKLISINEVLRQMNDTQDAEQMNNKQFAQGGNTDDTDTDITWDKNLDNFTVVAPKPIKLVQDLDDSIRNHRALKYSDIRPQINDDIEPIVDDNISSSLEDLRFAPAIGAGIGVLQNLFSKPNYSRADYLANTARRVGTIDPVTYSPLGDYLVYKPQDTDYIANRIAAQAAGTRRAINDMAGGNRAAAIGSTLMSDYNTQIQEADAIRKANEDNWNRLVGVTTFNRDTNKTNAEMALKTAMANQEAKLKAGQMELNGIDRAMTLKDTIDAQRATSLSGNLSNLFDSLGNIGIDALNRRDAKFNILHSDYSLPITEFARWFGKDNAKKEAKRRGFTDEEIKNMNFAKGGKLKRKKGEYSYAKL